MRTSRSCGAGDSPPRPDLRSFLIGLAVLVFVTSTVLYLRPGGLRKQLRFVARRFRLMLILGGIYVLANGVGRIVFQEGFIVDFGPPVLAIALGVAFIVFGQDPTDAEGKTPTRT